jgi:hypothetical protein
MKVKIKNKKGFKEVTINRRQAIHERCLNCASWHPKEVTHCPLQDCPLHSFRSGKGKQIAKARGKAIKDYCTWCMNSQKGEVRKCPSMDCPLYTFRKGGRERVKEPVYFMEKHHIGVIFQQKTVCKGKGPTEVHIS